MAVACSGPGPVGVSAVQTDDVLAAVQSSVDRPGAALGEQPVGWPGWRSRVTPVRAGAAPRPDSNQPARRLFACGYRLGDFSSTGPQIDPSTVTTIAWTNRRAMLTRAAPALTPCPLVREKDSLTPLAAETPGRVVQT
jgi:hypothetical protein